MIQLQPGELIVDSFAGGGGASMGIELALGRSPDIAINHDPEAIAMHKANHPNTRHYCESVYNVSPRKVVKGQKVGLIWLSPDCRHHSKAKGGKPVDKRIRGLAWQATRWARDVMPRIIIVENVEEFSMWGPLQKNGKPCPLSKGLTFRRWIREFKDLGYQVEWRELRACDYGAPTIRKRLFVVARCDGKPIVWPEATHGADTTKPYRTAAECIDWSIPCPSIFKRKRPLAENTLKRIARGLKRYVIDAADPFIVSCTQTGGGASGGVRSIKKPLPTIVTKAEQCLVSAFLAKHYSGVVGSELSRPTGTVTTVDHHSLVSCHLQRDFGNSTGSAMQEPVGTITAGGGGKSALVTSHMVKLRGGLADHKNTAQDMHEPVPTITAGGTHLAEVRAFLVQYYGTDGDPSLLDPLHTVTTRDRFGLVTVAGQEYQIVDIGLRMLSPRELFRAQGFPDSYKIQFEYNGKPLSKKAQVRMCGNSVSPPVAAAVVRANVGVQNYMGPALKDWEPGCVESGEQMALFDIESVVSA